MTLSLKCLTFCCCHLFPLCSYQPISTPRHFAGFSSINDMCLSTSKATALPFISSQPAFHFGLSCVFLWQVSMTASYSGFSTSCLIVTSKLLLLLFLSLWHKWSSCLAINKVRSRSVKVILRSRVRKMLCVIRFCMSWAWLLWESVATSGSVIRGPDYKCACETITKCQLQPGPDKYSNVHKYQSVGLLFCLQGLLVFYTSQGNATIPTS